MVETLASGKLAFFTTSSITRCGSPSWHFTFSSGVEKLVGSASRTALGSGERERISSRRQPA